MSKQLVYPASLLLSLVMVACLKWEYEEIDFVEVTTDTFTNVSTITMDVSGTIEGLAIGSVFEHGHCWSAEHSNPTIDDAHTELGSRFTNGEFVSRLTGLLPSRTYYVRAYSIYQNTVIYGAILEQQTQAVRISVDSVQAQGNREAIVFTRIVGLFDELKLLNHGFVWSNVHQLPTIEANEGLKSFGTTSRDGVFMGIMTGVENEVIHYIRPFLVLLDGQVIYGDPVEYTLTRGDFWLRKNDFAGLPRGDAIGFAIGNKGYLGMGVTTSFFDPATDFWEYNPQTDSWTQKADFAGGPRFSGIGFAIDGKGYVGLGSVGNLPGRKKDFWEYDTLANEWRSLPDFPGPMSDLVANFVVNGKGYIGTGVDEGGLFNYRRELWMYDPMVQEWQQKKSLPNQAEARRGAVGFGIDGYGYLGFGDGPSGSLSDFWRYDPMIDDWQEVAPLNSAGGRFRSVSFTILSKGYVVGGSGRTDCLEYDPATDKWTTRARLDSIRHVAIGFSINGLGYFGTGCNTDFDGSSAMWSYHPIK